MPIQALATANMLVCNSMMQANIVKVLASSVLAEMPCHQHMQNADNNDFEDKNKQQTSHQSSCVSVCANMCALTAIPVHIQSTFALNFPQLIDFKNKSYASVTLPSLQRPPIAFI